MTRPEFYRILIPDPKHLCRCCFSVLTCEGRLGGDPTEEAILAEDIDVAHPATEYFTGPCENCESIRRFEERRATLGAPPQRIGTGAVS